jgi:type I restriction enzyme M protein
MLDVETKRRIDTARDILVGKVPDPKSQVEQITIALIYKFMDDMDIESEELGGERSFFKGEFEKYAWHKIFDPRMGGFEILNLYSEAIMKMNVNPNIPQLFRDIFKNAYLPYRDPETLKVFLKVINEFTYDHSERLGDAFEYLLAVLGSQGEAGQFRTPRHIIDFMVEVIDPTKDETILDPACGTAGFLISSYKHIIKHNSSNYDQEEETKTFETKDVSLDELTVNSRRYNGDKLTPDERSRLAKNIRGYDISPDMVRLSLVNMYLHGLHDPHIHEYDTLTSEDNWNEYADVILANPPFMTPKGGIRPHKRFSITSNRSEVLFVDYIVEHLTPAGRAAVIVPEGIIFQSSNAYKNLRKMLVEQYLVGVISLPAGVFQPYSGVKTSILWMDKILAKKTDKILFVKIGNDGFDLGAQRRPIKENDLPFTLQRIIDFKSFLFTNNEYSIDNSNVLIVKRVQIIGNGDCSLSGDRYREVFLLKNRKWNYVKIGDIATLLNGRAYKAEELLDEGGTPVLRVGNLFSNKEWYYSDLDLDDSKYCETGDLLYAWSASFGPFIWDGPKAIYHYHIWKLVCSDQINKKFLYYLLGNITERVKEQTHGIAMLHITKSNMENLEIPFPPLSIQEEIVAEIENYQKIINGARQVVENYKPHIDIDPEWEMVELESITKQITDGTHRTPKYTESGVPFLRVTDITNSDSTKKFINQEEHRELIKRCHPQKGDTLYSKNGTIGIAKLIDWDYDFSIFVSLALLKPKKDIVNPEYLESIMNTEFVYNQALSHSKSGTVTNLHLVEIKSFRIPLPSMEIQKSIIRKLKEERQLIDSTRRIIEVYKQKIKDRITKVWGE